MRTHHLIIICVTFLLITIFVCIFVGPGRDHKVIGDRTRGNETPQTTILPAHEAYKISGSAYIDYNSFPAPTLHINLYNGSESWYVTKIRVAVIGIDASGNVLWRRSYEDMTGRYTGLPPSPIYPLSSGDVEISLTKDSRMKDFKFEIERLYGYQKP